MDHRHVPGLLVDAADLRRHAAHHRPRHARRRPDEQRAGGHGVTEEPGTEPHGITVHLDRLLEARGITLTELADRVGITVVNLSTVKTARPKAIRFSPPPRLCDVLDCQPADLLT